MKHKYEVGTPVKFKTYTGNVELTGKIEATSGFAADSPMYFILVDGSRPGYYAKSILRHEHELTPNTVAVANAVLSFGS